MRKGPASLLRKKMVRESLHDWSQFLAIILIGGIAVTLFVGLLSNAQSLSDRVETFYQQGNAADIYVTTKEYSWLDEGNIKSYLSENDQIESRFESTCSLEGKGSYAAISPTLPSISKATEFYDVSNSQSDTHFFVLDKMLSKNYGSGVSNKLYSVGDKMEMTLPLGSAISQKTASSLDSYLKDGGQNVLAKDTLSLSFTVTSFASMPENITKASYNSSTFFLDKASFRSELNALLNVNYTETGVDLIQGALGFYSDSQYEKPDNFPQSNQYLIALEDKTKRDEIEDNIAAFFKGKGEVRSNLLAITDRSSNPWSIAIDTDVLESRQLTFVFPFVFFFTALLVILTTISQIIIKERTQIGTMKALGLTKGEIYWHYISLSLLLVGIGIAIGCILGPIIIPAIMGQKYDILYSLPARTFFVFPWWQALLTAVIFLGTAALVTFLVCHKEVNLSPAQSMRNVPISFKGGQKAVKKKQGSIKLSLKMAFRNIRVNPVKSVMVISGVLGCTALLVCGFGIEDTLNYGISNDMSTFYDCDVNVTYASTSLTQKDKLLSADGVYKTEEFLATSSSFSYQEEGSSKTTGFSSTLRFYEDDSEYFLVDYPAGTVAISNKVSSELGAKQGDLISFTYNGGTFSKEVGVVYEAFTFHGVCLHYSDLPNEFPDGHLYSGAFVDIKEGYSSHEVASSLAEVAGVSAAKSQDDMSSDIRDIMSGVYIMTNAVKVFAILLAVVVLYNLALLNFRQRQRDIATLKVLGFSQGEIALSLLAETMTLTGVGVLGGLALGYPFMYLVLYVNRVSLVEFLYHVYPITYLYGFLISFVVAFLVNLWLSNLTRKVQMVESLKSVE